MGWHQAMAIAGSAGILAAVFGILFVGFSLLRIASRPTPKPAGLDTGANVVPFGQPRAAVDQRGGPAQELDGAFPSEERVNTMRMQGWMSGDDTFI